MTVMRYGEMKDSGVEWIGEVPTGWEVNRVKQKFTILTGSGFPPEYQGNENANLPVCKASDISNAGPLLVKAANYISHETAKVLGFNIIPAGSILFAKIGEAMKKNNRTRCKIDCCVDNNCQGMVPKNFDSIFAYYLFCCIDMRWYDNGGTIPCINNKKLADCPIPVPTLTEQTAIASYLDDQCGQIDDIISSTKSVIEEYKQWKASVIFEAVTKGLDPSVSMKDSGVEWIGEIPQEWKTIKLKFLCTMKAGKNLTSEQISDEGQFAVYGGNGIRGYYSDFNYDGDTLLVGRQGALCGNVHKVQGQFWATEHAVITEHTNLSDRNYLFYLLLAMDLNQYSSSAAQPGIAVETISKLSSVIPPLSEQQAISDYLDTRCAEIDSIIAEKESLIADLESYKKSLIYEIVTGKRKVA